MSLASFIPTMNCSCALRPVVNISCTARSSPFSVRGITKLNLLPAFTQEKLTHHKHQSQKKQIRKHKPALTAVQQPVALDLHHYTKESRPGYHQNLAVPPANWICSEGVMDPQGTKSSHLFIFPTTLGEAMISGQYQAITFVVVDFLDVTDHWYFVAGLEGTRLRQVLL